MDGGVLLEVWRVSEYADEEIFCCDVEVETGRDDEANETDSIRDFLDCWACGTERGRGNPLSAPSVYDQGE